MELSRRGIEVRTGLSRLLLGAQRILLEEIEEVSARGKAIDVELIDGQRRAIPVGSASDAEELAQRIDDQLHPARRALPAVGSAQELADALTAAIAGDSLPSALLELLLLGAARLGASDLHLERCDGALALRLRIDGRIHDVGTLRCSEADRLLGRLKVIAGLVSYRVDVVQEGRAAVALSGVGRVSARVTTSPSVTGEQAVVRLHDPKKQELALDALGFDDDVLAQLRAAARYRRGLVVVAGPPSSGKSTTLFALLRQLQRFDREAGGSSLRLISIEDPAEVDLAGVAQTQVDLARGNTYARLLRTALRQDADVLLVGEMRDAETAQLVLQASLCGHLVLTTVHGGSVAEATARLAELGLDGERLGGSLRLVLAQRLVRRRCASCSGCGCPVCHDTGFAGRFALGEAWTAPESARWREGAALVAAAKAQVKRGATTDAEVARVLGQ